jgi:hypothetical protein
VESELPSSVRDFIGRHIVSVEALEVLLILHEGKDRAWTAAEINERLRSQESSIAQRLESMVSLGLAVNSGARFRFAPVSEETAKTVADLATAYRERRIKVIELIFSKPNGNLLNFVRAFDLRKNP